jgi:hypothetical protein
MGSTIARRLLPACAVLLVACGTPESDCRAGVHDLKKRMEGLIGSGEHKDAADPVVKAHTATGIAETQLAVGNFAGCLESLAEARGHLRASQRTNVQ